MMVLLALGTVGGMPEEHTYMDIRYIGHGPRPPSNEPTTHAIPKYMIPITGNT